MKFPSKLACYRNFFIFTIVWAIGFCSLIKAKGPFHGQVGMSIERSFGTGNPEHLKPYLPDSGKIHLSIPAAGLPDGNYSRNQVLALLRQMFERVITRSFTLHGGNLPNLQRGPVRATWKFVDRNTQKEHETTIYFTITSNPLKPIIKAIKGEVSSF
ncbi:hypothetical protein JW979_16460 [bacterium]|nr:hypothetical protein [candidate division CSSED10-310 bacterium]